MVAFAKKLVEGRGITETTAESYINIFKQLNDGKSYANLGFLRKKEGVMAKIESYADSTQRSTLGAVVSALTLMKDKPSYKAIYNFYYERMEELTKKEKESKDTTEKTDTQKANWMKWADVLAKRDELAKSVEGIGKSKLITPTQWNTLLAYVLLSLYTYEPPRRNQDYQDLYVVKKWTDSMNKDKNYYDLSTHKFIFHKYKTSKSHGVQEVSLADNKALQDVLALYLKVHPHKKSAEYRFLVNADGSALSSVNSITRILNRIFGKQIGSSMLRHIYLSDKYDVKEMKEDAEKMGHTLAVQREYMKAD